MPIRSTFIQQDLSAIEAKVLNLLATGLPNQTFINEVMTPWDKIIVENLIEILENSAEDGITLDYDTPKADFFIDADGYLATINTGATDAEFDSGDKKYVAGSSAVVTNDTEPTTVASDIFGPNNDVGQTFTAPKAFTLNRVSVWVKKTGSPGALQADIFLANGAHEPTGASLGTGSVPASSVSTSNSLIPIDFSPGIALTNALEYAIVLSQVADAGSDPNDYQFPHSGSDDLADGWKIHTTNGGTNWTVSTSDRGFIVFELDSGTCVQTIDGTLPSGTTDIFANVKAVAGSGVKYGVFLDDNTEIDSDLALDTMNTLTTPLTTTGYIKFELTASDEISGYGVAVKP